METYVAFEIKIADLTNQNDKNDIIELIKGFNGESTSGGGLDSSVLNELIPNIIEFGNYLIYLAYVDGKAAGFSICFEGFSTFKAKKILNIHDFYISNEFQGNGYGYLLMKHIIDDAGNRGYCKITLEVYSTNPRAINLYRKCGFSGNIEEEEKQQVFFMANNL